MSGSDTMLEVDFNSNSILQNRFVRWGLHLLIYYKIVLSLADMELPTKTQQRNSRKNQNFDVTELVLKYRLTDNLKRGIWQNQSPDLVYWRERKRCIDIYS